MIKLTRFKRNVIFNAGGGMIGGLLQLLLVAVLARFLNIADYAGYLMAAAVIGIGERASDFGARVWAIRNFALSSTPGLVMRQALTSKLFFSSIGALILVLAPIKILGPWGMVLVFFIAVTQPSTDPFLWNMRGKEKLDLEAIIVMVWRIAVALALIAMALTGFSLSLLLLAWMLGNILRITAESILPVTRPLLSLTQDGGNPGEIRGMVNLIGQIFPLGVAMFLMTLFSRLGVVLLGYLGDNASVAIYGTAVTLAAASGFMAMSITMAYFPRLSRAVQDSNQQVTVSIVKQQINMITLTYGTLCALGIIFSPLAVHLLYGKKFAASGLVMVLLMPVLYISCINVALKFTLNAMGYNWMDAFSVAAGIVTFFIAFWIITVLPRPQTLALAWGLGELMIFGCKTITCKYVNLPAGTSIYLILITLGLLSAAAGLRWFYFPKF